MSRARTIRLMPMGRRLAVTPGRSLLEILTEASIPVAQACAGQGTCGKCRVLISDRVSRPSSLDRQYLSQKELVDGVRLACSMYPAGGETVEVSTDLPSFGAKGDLEHGTFPLSPWPEHPAAELGLAVDMGTTNVVAHLLDVTAGRVLASTVVPNRQSALGADVMTRLAHASEGGSKARERLQNLAVADLEVVAANVLPAGRRIDYAVAVMNPAIETLLLNLDPDCLGRAPWEPERTGSVSWQLPVETGLLAGVAVHIPPAVGGYVGSDAVAALHATLAGAPDCPFLLIDIGTNAEAVLVTGDTILACSTAAGPAFEGAGISRGMRAVVGAVDRVMIDDGRPVPRTIGGGRPQGIAGSGLFSLIGALLRFGALDPFGSFVAGALAPGVVRPTPNGREVVLVPEVTVTEGDIQQFLLAKAATRGGVDCLLARANLHPGDLAGIYLTGAFASCVQVEDVLSTGLVPRVEAAKIRSLGNAAATGAAMMACSRDAFRAACELAEGITHLRLAGDSAFIASYTEQICFEQVAGAELSEPGFQRAARPSSGVQ